MHCRWPCYRVFHPRVTGYLKSDARSWRGTCVLRGDNSRQGSFHNDSVFPHVRVENPPPCLDEFGDENSNTQRGRKSSFVTAAVYECIRIHPDGRIATVYLKRRDLLRLFGLDPRDLRCIDPNLHYTRSSPSIYVRGNAILAQVSGVRLIITAQTALLLDPHSASAHKLLGQLIPKLQVVAGHRLMAETIRPLGGGETIAASIPDDLPFELDVLEAALHVCINKLDSELVYTQDLVNDCLKRLPRDITPQNLDDLRKAKGALVELESKSDAFREVLEDMMNDDDELKEFNLSSRVEREERRRQRERGRLERKLQQEQAQFRPGGGSSGSDLAPFSSRNGSDSSPQSRAGLEERESQGRDQIPIPDNGDGRSSQSREPSVGSLSGGGYSEWEQSLSIPSSSASQGSGSDIDSEEVNTQATIDLTDFGDNVKKTEDWSWHQEDQTRGKSSWIEASQAFEGLEGSEETFAMQELRAMFEQEEEEQDLQEVEDLLEFYLQRSTAIQTEAERLLAGARDLEESIGLTLSARRFEVQRLELRLSIGSFAAAIGAVLAGIFGMNLRSTLEESIFGFWGTTGLIILGCIGIYMYILQWTRSKKILM